MKLMMNIISLLVLVLIFPNQSKAARLKIGPLVDQEVEVEIETSTFLGEVKFHSENFKSSNSNHLRLRAIRFYDQNLEKVIAHKSFGADETNQLLKDLIDPSRNITDAAQTFFDHHILTLIKKQWLKTNHIAVLSEKIYSSQDDYIVFLSLILSLLDNHSFEGINPEYSFNIIDGLYRTNRRILVLSSKILIKHGQILTEKKLLELSHLSRFVSMLKEIPSENHEAYFEAFKSNFFVWTKSDLLQKEDIQQILNFSTRFSPALLEKVYDFIVKPEVIEILTKLNIFDREWAVRLKFAILNPASDSSRQTSMNLLSYFLPAFVDSKVFFKEDFIEIWTMLDQNLEGFIDPFLLVRKNFKNLSQYGWFNQKDYDRLLSSYPQRGSHAQSLILSFVDDLYDWLSVRGWLSATPLSKALFENHNDSKKTLIEKLQFIAKHPDLISRRQLVSADQIEMIFKHLNNNDPDIYQPSLTILKKGFENWTKSKALTENFLLQYLDDLNPQASHTALVLAAITENYEKNPLFFSKTMIESLSAFCSSTNPKVSSMLIDFFKEHFEELKEQSVVTSKAKKNLKGLGVLPKASRRGSRSKSSQ